MSYKSKDWTAVFLLSLILFLLISGVIGVIVGEVSQSSTHGGGYVAKVRIEGAIMDATDWLDQLEEAKKDKKAKAVVVVINSPGGAVTPSEMLHHSIAALAKEKPLVVSMQTVAASGGYMAAVGAPKIFALESTITGSIGVIMQSMAVYDLMEKVGLKSQTIKTGAYKDAGSPFRPMTEQDHEYFQNLANDMLDFFVTLIAEGRQLAKEEVLEVADGRVFTGRQAQSLGLIDEIGGERQAVAWLKSTHNLRDDLPVRDMEPESSRILKALQESGAQMFMNFFSSFPRAYYSL